MADINPDTLKTGMLFRVTDYVRLHECLTWPLDTWGWSFPKGCGDGHSYIYADHGEALLLIDIIKATHAARPVAKSYVYLVFLAGKERGYVVYEYNRWKNNGMINVGDIELVKK